MQINTFSLIAMQYTECNCVSILMKFDFGDATVTAAVICSIEF